MSPKGEGIQEAEAGLIPRAGTKRVTLPTRWTFYNFDAVASAIIGDPIGRATLRNLQFLQPAPDFFNKSDGAKEDRPPTTQP